MAVTDQQTVDSQVYPQNSFLPGGLGVRFPFHHDTTTIITMYSCLYLTLLITAYFCLFTNVQPVNIKFSKYPLFVSSDTQQINS